MSILRGQAFKRLALATLAGTVFAMAFAQPAAAHKSGHRPAVSDHYYGTYERRVIFPRWLRKDRGFQRWFYRSDYRYIVGYNRRISWEQLYDRYRFERRYYRNGPRRFRSRTYAPSGFYFRSRRW